MQRFRALDASHFAGNFRRGQHSPSHGFTVKKAAIIGGGFEAVADGMAEIQGFTRAGVALVLGNDFRFLAHAARDHPFQRGGILAQQAFQPPFDKTENAGIADDAVFDHFEKPGAILARRKRAQRLRIGQHHLRLVKRANQIFPLGQIDAGFAANRAIHLRDQCGGNVHDADAAQITSGDETGDVSHHAAADGNRAARCDRRRPRQARGRFFRLWRGA